MTGQSQKYALNKEDVKKWLTNTLVFLGPALIAFLGALAIAVRDNAPKEGNWATGAIIALYLINVLTDLLKKFLAGPRS